MKSFLRGLLPLVIAFGISPVAVAALHVVNVNSGSFSPNNIEIDQGDQIRWEYVAGSPHTTTSIGPGVCTTFANPNGSTFGQTRCYPLQPMHAACTVYASSLFGLDSIICWGIVADPEQSWNATISSSSPNFTRTFNTFGNFNYRCTPHGFTGVIQVVAPSGILDDPSSGNTLPGTVALRQNSPNPFNAATQIEYGLDIDGVVDLAVYNILGQRMITLVSGFQPGGFHTVLWDGRDEHGRETPSGIYFARMSTLNAQMTRKMVLLR